MEHGDGGVCGSHGVGQLAGAVRRPVVDDQDVSVRNGREHGLGDWADVLALVVRRDDDPDPGTRGRHRLPWGCGVAAEDTPSLPSPACAAAHVRPASFCPGTTKCPEEPLRSFLQVRVYWSL